MLYRQVRPSLVTTYARNFRASLTRELMARLGVSPVFSTPYHPESIVECCIKTLKNKIVKMALTVGLTTLDLVYGVFVLQSVNR